MSVVILILMLNKIKHRCRIKSIQAIKNLPCTEIQNAYK